MRREETGCKLGFLVGGRKDSAQPWPGSRGGGSFAQGHKGPVTDELSGYVSVSPHHTPSFFPDVWNVIFTFPGDMVGEGTEVSLQAAGEKSHIHQFA